MDQMWDGAANIMDQLRKEGYMSYIVGGAVRDRYLKRRIRDIDIVTDASVPEVRNVFPKAKTIGKSFQIVLVKNHGLTYEVSPFRAFDNAYGQTLLEKDLSCRDFTINAIAMTRHGHWIDPFGGRKDLDNGIIRGVNRPIQRFQEDPLRILRAFRFMSELNFSIERQTYQACHLKRRSLKNIASERIFSELDRLLAGQYSDIACQDMDKLGIWSYVFPYQRRPTHWPNFSMLLCSQERWAALLLLTERSPHHLRRLRVPTHLLQSIRRLIKGIKWRSEGHRWTNIDLYDFGLDRAIQVENIRHFLNIKDVMDEKQLRASYEQLPLKHRSQLKINGRDIVLHGRLQGKEVGLMLHNIERHVLHGILQNDRDELLRFIKEGR